MFCKLWQLIHPLYHLYTHSVKLCKIEKITILVQYNLKLTCTYPFLDSSSTILFLDSFFSSTLPKSQNFNPGKINFFQSNYFTCHVNGKIK
ncbi:hypothetical protein BpHYR1_018939 [Brachionus plicatilis]|uniref:Uncharacterized protein n=1 Tax=Brachionus plicatilis TaxID=10195 RepID=A0A3M7P6K7_BRAPC|nr:hypothetical protein BpHYR1_018939 [Brachionus plicatilis]